MEIIARARTVPLERFGAHQPIPVVMDIIDEIHHVNLPIRRSGAAHRSKLQAIS
jgi:hypothetical protein